MARSLEDAWVVREPQDRVIAYGRKIDPTTIDTPDGPITYWRKIRVYANSYSPARSGTPRSAPWYGRTRIGLPLAKGLVAIDPSVIRMQQRMYVPGYGFGMAADTGGGVRRTPYRPRLQRQRLCLMAPLGRHLPAMAAAARLLHQLCSTELAALPRPRQLNPAGGDATPAGDPTCFV